MSSSTTGAQPAQRSRIGLLLSAAFGFSTYIVTVAVILHTVAFLHAGPPAPGGSAAGSNSNARFPALVVDCGLLILFAVQHSAMATQWFKTRVLARICPNIVERSVYVLASSVCLEVVLLNWRFGSMVWDVSPHLRLPLDLAHILGWILIFSAAVQVDYLELLGLLQIRYAFINRDAPIVYRSQRVQALYRHMRHPMLIGALLVLLSTPVMTTDRLLLVVGFAAYEMAASRLDHRDVEYVRQQLLKQKRKLLDEAQEEQ
ncbi:hypothetical protein CAOG_06296 [Capsaspora owczarzaki ATCC 30864]|uniref:Nuclear envelope membrane protein n=1 Tax=Capsaspora owczarzaki (strain ATCC 30864) TaxID=595528 RepID=A0A0D2VWF0_CAPO3|nr:hypothetical protein CAOG_06296 [Capsaspora owczarzaki ATCC 30864]KJE95902.1 hypothetical protein CAOG_006296 [Capsaspora owczarzaki ATCC 30864]|eukprot:XP_004345045.1 hypothetical protein CAOG_06296 [Capsaspora owczarzaki ATCC 30864]